MRVAFVLAKFSKRISCHELHILTNDDLVLHDCVCWWVGLLCGQCGTFCSDGPLSDGVLI